MSTIKSTSSIFYVLASIARQQKSVDDLLLLNNKNCIIYSKDVIRGLNDALRVKDNSFVDQAFQDVRKNYTWKIRAKNILKKTNVIS